jgi:predicted nucleotidyltransferase
MGVKMSFIEFLKKDKDARRIFGKGELKIIEKQLLGINLTQSEKNRLSRDIRKKLEFIKRAARFEDEFELKKGAVVKELIEEAKEVILKSSYFPKIKKIILFGSTVENERTFRSDIDIAVEFNEIEKLDAGRFRIYVLGRVKDRIDVQVYNVLPDKIKKEIDLKGRLLYERKNKR